ncbi:preprotein translocase subunit SecD [Aeromonas diversa CDC 2478-85]|uniref:Protein translocase subunit SecD n=1 Tax=Aeromonas diversa CDC 2478-85 TaxID=1268237 RepID=N9TXV9_9GAMM|nr:protein translocase subunit SecD [Aeromonas diversa]ENY70895.1 preprotein translocase subunit SecD [Aeromonas diversa CDC 2478-85]
MTNQTRRRAKHGAINRMSRWRYALLLLMLATFTFYSLPTFFGEQPSIGLHGQTALSDAQAHALAERHIAPRLVIAEADRLELVFTSQDEQQGAKLALDALGASTTLEFHANAPAWLKALGAAPIKLGLDLRGGSQLLIAVDTDFVLERQTSNLVDSLRSALREARLRGAVVQRIGLDKVAVTLPAGEPAAPYLSLIRPELGQGQWQLEREAGRLLLTLSPKERSELINNAVSQNQTILQKRIHELGIVEAAVQRQGQSAIRIELPGVHNPKQAKEVLGATASLAFYEVVPEGGVKVADRSGRPIPLARKPVLTGEHIVDARASMGESGQPQVGIVLDGAGGSVMSRFSRLHVGKPMASLFTEYKSNGEGKLIARSEVINVATIQTALGSQFRITGLASMSEAQDLAMLLRAGALTAPLKILEERSIGPTLGMQNIEAGFSALAFGMAGMALFMILWYRKFGWVAITALVANLLMQVGMLALLPGAVLTLPGIAGLVLTVGMAVDTHVLIFERIKDRLREGASLASAIDFGYRSAFRTIFDANITTLISAVILYSVGSGPLQGFSITLILGLISSMITGIWGTRAIINPLWGQSSQTLLRV